MNDPDPEVRRIAIGALGFATDVEVLPALRHALSDTSWQVREEAAERTKEELAAEKAHFGKTTEGDWENREEVLKASSEAEVLQERSLLLGVVADYFGGMLRKIHAHHEGDSAALEESRRLIRSLDAVEKLRSSLERGIQEGLALEAGFLELMMASKPQ